VVLDDDGAATVRLPVHIGQVGTGECRRGRPCAIGVLGGSQWAAVARLALAGTAGADPPRNRVVTGWVVAAAASVAGVVLVRRTDWAPAGGDPFAGISVGVPPGWEDLRHIDDDEDLAGW
jgi:hypothetical protein